MSLSKKLMVKVGQSKKLKLKNNKKKVTWKVVSGKKNITLKSRKKTGVTVKGRKKGTAKVQAKIGKKKYTCKVTVKAKAKAKPKATPTPKPTPTATPTKKPGQDILTLYYNNKNAEEVKKQIRNSKVPVHVIVEDSVTDIGEYAFSGCSGLTSITIPDSVTRIGYGAFKDCSGLTSITIPGSVTSIERNEGESINSNAFSGCSGLTSITVAEGNRTYDSRENCNAIIETDENTLITGCKNTTISDSVTSIRGDAFRGCSGLTSITIPDSVTSIGSGAFYKCDRLTSIKWKGKTYSSVDAFRKAFDS